MRIYNPQNQFGKDLVTYELVNTKLSAITGYSLDDETPLTKGTLQAQIDNIVEGGLRYKVLPNTAESGIDSWTLLKGIIDKQKTTTPLTDDEKAKIRSYLKTVILVNERQGKEGNIYTEYLVFEDSTDHYAYEKIGEIGGDVSELISRINALETNGVQSVSAATDETGVTANAIEVATVTSTDDTKPVKKVTIKVKKATTTTYGVVKISAALPDTNPSTEIVVSEKVLADVKTALEEKIEELTNGDTIAVGQVRTVSLTVGDEAGEAGTSGTFTIAPTGVSKVKILAVEDNTGEQWSYKLSTDDGDNGKVFQVWNGVAEYNAMVQADTAPDSFTVSYAVVSLTPA